MDGGCLCGAIRYRADALMRRMTHCHCLDCRRTSGAAFLTWVAVASSAFHPLRGTPARHASRVGIERGFCRDCGSQLTYHDDAEPAVVYVTAGSLDEQDGVAPEDHVWCDRLVPWLRLDDDLPRYPRAKADGPD